MGEMQTMKKIIISCDRCGKNRQNDPFIYCWTNLIIKQGVRHTEIDYCLECSKLLKRVREEMDNGK